MQVPCQPTLEYIPAKVDASPGLYSQHENMQRYIADSTMQSMRCLTTCQKTRQWQQNGTQPPHHTDVPLLEPQPRLRQKRGLSILPKADFFIKHAVVANRSSLTPGRVGEVHHAVRKTCAHSSRDCTQTSSAGSQCCGCSATPDNKR